MRPEILFPLYASPQTLLGIGAKVAKILSELAGDSLISLCWRLPTGFIDRSRRVGVAEAPLGELSTLEVRVLAHRPPRYMGRSPYRVPCQDETGEIHIVFFRAHADYLRRVLPEGERRFISGIVEDYQGQRQMAHPHHIMNEEEFGEMPSIEAVYRVMSGISARQYARIVREALKRVPSLPEWLTEERLREKDWRPWKDALLEAHAPQTKGDLSPLSLARQRLAYDEFLSNQLALALTRQWMRRLPGRRFPIASALREKTLASLPFALTGAQRQALRHIDKDMGSSIRMLRLLQGDVGSGKTIVAFLAMLNAVSEGAQAAIMAPTEILARQHFLTLAPLCEKINVSITLLTARQSAAERRDSLQKAAEGSASIVAGTHSLFQKDVRFRDLGLCVIDEQHRFGVHQRLQLSGKGQRGVDMLVMTATPIPRTLVLTNYGDMDVSSLREKPPGRQPITSRALPIERLEEVVEAARRAGAQGRRIYWICPLVGEDASEDEEGAATPAPPRMEETHDLTAARERYEHLSSVMDFGVGLVHGRMASDKKAKVLADFQEGRARLLVATSVIEVGIDVPEATVMVIEDAQRFGLAQLHQMRGRIGRGSGASACLLLYRAPLSDTARQRLAVMRETEDGFRIAEEDLRLRGGGELLGTRQSGAEGFVLGDLSQHGDLFAEAHEETLKILAEDPHLKSERGERLRLLLYLFGRDEAVRYLRSG